MKDEQKLEFLSKIDNKLSEFHGITSYEFEIFNNIKLEESNRDSSEFSINDIKKVGEENNSNEQRIENRILQEKIKANIEKILSYIKDKKEYEFITDFFINENDPSINSNFMKQNSSGSIINQKESNLSQKSINSILNDTDYINEDFMTLLSKANLIDIQSITKFNEELNKNKKSISGEIQSLPSFVMKKNSGIKEEDLFLPEMRKVKISKDIKNNDNNGIQSKEEMDKELEEEINRQIFGYTKKMKESARNFGKQLKKDNQTLSNIENLQDKVHNKTNKEIKRLEEFNYSIKIGFCKLMLLIFTVVGSFFGTIFIMKIFPKLA
jgi:hypothetical protein